MVRILILLATASNLLTTIYFGNTIVGIINEDNGVDMPSEIPQLELISEEDLL